MAEVINMQKPKTPSNTMTIAKLIAGLEAKYGRDSNLQVVDSLGNPINRIKLIIDPTSLLPLESNSGWKKDPDNSDKFQAEVTAILQLTSDETINFIANDFEHPEMEA